MIISVPATSANLGPGFDTLGLAIELENRAIIKRSNYFSVSIKGEGSHNPKLKTNNQFINIFYNFYTRLTGKKDNFRFEFHNKIPISRGLGSSSAMITSAIAAAYKAAGVEISKNSILDKSLFYEPHPDNIAPAVYGGFTVSVIENGRVFTQKKKIPSYLKTVMVIPKKPMSTAKSRMMLPKAYKSDITVYNISHSSLLSAAFFNEDWKMLKIASKDKIHQKMRMRNMPELFNVQKIALQNGALMSTLSGSGSSFFNMVFEDDAKILEQKLKESFSNFFIMTYNFNNYGLNIENN